jgi:hypothetical protein
MPSISEDATLRSGEDKRFSSTDVSAEADDISDS